MVTSLSKEKHDDFYQQVSSIVGLSVPFQVRNRGKDYQILRAVGYRVSPKSGAPPSCFENETPFGWVFLHYAHIQQVVLGYMVPVAEVTTNISCNTKLTFHPLCW